MLRIKVSTFPQSTIIRQTPQEKGLWKDAAFFVNTDVVECDAWVVHEEVSRQESAICPPDNVILITGEPPDIKTYDARWLEAFSCVRSCHTAINHPGLSLGSMSLNWHVGKTYDQLVAMEPPQKTEVLSVICSTKAICAGHRTRLRFVNQLEPLISMHRFGHGVRPLADKWDGLAAYRYSIAIENSQVPHYWTEKIADCFLAGTVPIYWGCPNIEDYFPSDAMIRIESLDPQRVSEQLNAEATLEGYHRRLDALREAKRLVLEDYNLFNLARDLAAERFSAGPPARITLRPEPAKSWTGRIRQFFR